MLTKEKIAEIFNAIVLDKKKEFSESDISVKMYKDFNAFLSNFLIKNPGFDVKKYAKKSNTGETGDEFTEFVIKIAQQSGLDLLEGVKRINSFNEFNKLVSGCISRDEEPNILVYQKDGVDVGRWYPNFNYGVFYEDRNGDYPPDEIIMKTDMKKNKAQEFIMMQSLSDIPMSMSENCHNYIKLFLISVNSGTWKQTDLDTLIQTIENGDYGKDSTMLIDLVADYSNCVAVGKQNEYRELYNEILALSAKLHIAKNAKQITESSLTNYSKGDVITITSTDDFSSKLPSGWYKALTSSKLLDKLFKKGGKLSIEVTNDDANTMTGLDVDISVIGDAEAPYLNAIKEIKEFFNFDEESLIFYESKDDDFDFTIHIVGGIIGKDKKDNSFPLKGVFGVKKTETGDYVLKGKQGEFWVTYEEINGGGLFDVVDDAALDSKEFKKNGMYTIYQDGVAKQGKFVGVKDDKLLFEIDDTLKQLEPSTLKGVNSEKTKKLKLDSVYIKESADEKFSEELLFEKSKKIISDEYGSAIGVQKVMKHRDNMYCVCFTKTVPHSYYQEFADTLNGGLPQKWFEKPGKPGSGVTESSIVFTVKPEQVTESENVISPEIQNIYDKANAILTKKANASSYDESSDTISFPKPKSMAESGLLINVLDGFGYKHYKINGELITFKKA